MRLFWLTPPKLRPHAQLYAPLLLAYLLSTLLYAHRSCAAKRHSIGQEDHNHPLMLELSGALNPTIEARGYEPDFLGIDRSIIGRADDDNTVLANNAPGHLTINQGEDQFWTFPKQALFGPKSPPTPGLPSPLNLQNSPPEPSSPDERILYISLTTCQQPNPKSSTSKGAPAQLKLFVSLDSGNKQPGLARNDLVVPIDEGFGWLNISSKNDVYFGVSAPDNDDFSGVYDYQLTASIDGFYASIHDETYLNFIDSDTTSALLYTNNLTCENSSDPYFQSWMSSQPRFSIFLQNQDNPSIQGMQKSVCALQNFADVRDPTAIDTDMTLAGDNQPKQQFHVRDLNASSSYHAIVAIIGNSTNPGNGVVGGGGTTWGNLGFQTKSGLSTSRFFKPSTERVHLQITIAHCYTISRSVLRSPTLSQPTPQTTNSRTLQHWVSIMIITPNLCMVTLVDRFNKSRATPPPRPNIRSQGTVRIALELTKLGFVRSQSLGVKTFRIPPPIYCHVPRIKASPTQP